MTRPRNGYGAPGADGGDMRTPRRHRLTRRQSDQLLERLDGPDDLARLLADARRSPAAGELPGESAVLVAFRENAVTVPDPHTRSLPVRTLMLSRALVAKVLATTTAVVAIGGVAVAATGHLPVSSHASAHSTSAHPTGVPTGKPAADKDDDHATSPTTSSPSQDPRAHRDDRLPAVGLCRAWADVSRNAPDAARKSKVFQELAKRAGGADHVATYCATLVDAWCSDHKWPASVSVGVEGRPYLFKCLRHLPTDRPTASPTDIHRAPGMPIPSTTMGTPPITPLPTGAPVRN